MKRLAVLVLFLAFSSRSKDCCSRATHCADRAADAARRADGASNRASERPARNNADLLVVAVVEPCESAVQERQEWEVPQVRARRFVRSAAHHR